MAGGLTFQWEPMRRLLDEPNVPDLLRGHYEECGIHADKFPLDPDFARYVEMDEAGLYRVWTVRDGDNLAGYIGWFVQRHLHHKTVLTAVADLLLLDPPHRSGMAGYRMFATSFDALRQLGVQWALCDTTLAFAAERGGLTKLFERLGFAKVGQLWSMVL